MYALILTIAIYQGGGVATLAGFKSVAACEAAGVAWVAANKTVLRSPHFICVNLEAK